MDSKIIVLLIAAIVVSAGAGYFAGTMVVPSGVDDYQTGYDEGYTQGLADGEFPNGVLKIGVTGPMTGALASEGDEFIKGVTMAVEEINARGGLCGYELEIVSGDTEDFEPGKITTIYEKLITQDNVDAIFTGYASQTQNEFEICKRYNMIYFISADAMSTEEIIGAAPEEYPTIFNTVTSYISYQTELPKRMEQWYSEDKIDLPNRKVAIITSDNYYSSWISEGLRDNFEGIGWEITMYEMVPFGTFTEWGPMLEKIRSDPPALIVNTDYIASNEATFMEQFLQNPTQSHMFIQYGPSTPEFINLLGDSSTGVIYNSPSLGIYVESYKQGVALREKFSDRWGFDPGSYGPTLYVQVMIWAQAVEMVGDPKDHLAVGKAILDNTAFWGGGGLITFDPATHLSDIRYSTPTFYQIWDGDRYVVDPEPYNNGEIQNPPWWSEG
jgi:branched-chain amino acid transport system substrate-binding protein